MAVIGIGTASRASVEDVLAVIEAAKAEMAEEVRRPPHPNPLPKGRGSCRLPASSGVPSPLGEKDRMRGDLLTTLAALDRPALNGVLQEAARRAGLDLLLLTLDQLRAAAHLCATHSEHSMKQYGIPSVAEAAALAGAGSGARLLFPRIVGRNATASVAGRP